MVTELVIIAICTVAVAFFARFLVALCAEKPKERCEITMVSSRKQDLADIESFISRQRWIESPYEFGLAEREERRS